MRLSQLNGRILIVVVVALAAVAVFLAFPGGSGTRTLTAHFSQAVSIYKGSEIEVMGVRIGQVTAVVPEGDTVRVDMEYDDQYKLPADVKAAIVTPTLVSDRFVQLVPAYGGGAALPNGGDIPLARTAVPVELDRIYSSLGDLSEALGPNGANKKGALSELLGAGAKALKGNGQLGHDMLSNLSDAAQVLGDNSGELFGTVENLARFTSTLQANDKTVGQFMTSLSAVSTQLAGERGNLRKALVAIANAVGTVRDFVHDNRSAVTRDVKDLTTTLDVLARQKDTLATVLQLAPLGLGNLTLANDNKTGTVGIRLQTQSLTNLGTMLCNVVSLQKNVPKVAVDGVCKLLTAVLPNVSFPALPAPGGTPGASAAQGAPPAGDLGSLLGPGGTP